MTRRGVLAGISAGLLAAAVLPGMSWAQGDVPRKPATIKVAIKTSKGAIVLELESERAPVATRNFLRYVDQKKLDNAEFYRSMPFGDDAGIIQGGGDYSRSMPGVKAETTAQSGLSHTDGVVSAVRGPYGAQGDFFICIGDMSVFDAGKDGTPDKLGFPAFGHVVEGMDVARLIFQSPKSKTAGVGPLKGQMLSPPVRILSIRRLK